MFNFISSLISSGANARYNSGRGSLFEVIVISALAFLSIVPVILSSPSFIFNFVSLIDNVLLSKINDAKISLKPRFVFWFITAPSVIFIKPFDFKHL